MDRVTQRRKQGNHLIGQRYLVQTELVNNNTGILYQARDMRASDNASIPVLVHIFPNKALPSTPLKLMTERLQALSAQTDAAVLKVLDSGWLNTQAYFVLESPRTWSLSALPPMQGNTTRIHKQALQLNRRLNEQGVLRGYLPTSLFLVTAHGEVYLPSTALAPNLLSLTESPELLLTAHELPKRSAINMLPWVSLGFISIVAASGAGLYYQHYVLASKELLRASHAPVDASNQPLETVVDQQISEKSNLNKTASLADQPLTATTTTTQQPVEAAPTSKLAPLILPTTPTTASKPAPELNDRPQVMAHKATQTAPEIAQPKANLIKPMQDKTIKPQRTSTAPVKPAAQAEKKTTPKPEPKPEFVEDTDPSVNLPSPRSELIKAVVDTQAPQAQFTGSTTTPTAVEFVPTPPLQPLAVAAAAPVLGAVHPNQTVSKPASVATPVNPVVTTVPTPVARIQSPTAERDADALTANGLTSTELVQKAYQALQAGRLDEQPNHGAVYFIRLLERIDHGNPQILRLARETSYQLHQQVRTALIQGDAEQASQKLWRTGRIIKEFNLVHLNPAQELLEHKLAE